MCVPDATRIAELFLILPRVTLTILNLLIGHCSFLSWIDVNWETILESSSCLFKSLVVKLLAAEAGDPHVSWLVCEVLVSQFTGTLLHNSIVERFGLIELFPILGSVLISVGVFLRGPAGAIPQGRVHHVPRAIIQERLTGPVQIGLVLNVLVNLNSSISWEFLRRVASSENRWGLLLRVNIACTESSLIGFVFWMVMRMSLWHRLGAVSPRGGIQRVISDWNPFLVESKGEIIG